VARGVSTPTGFGYLRSNVPLRTFCWSNRAKTQHNATSQIFSTPSKPNLLFPGARAAPQATSCLHPLKSLQQSHSHGCWVTTATAVHSRKTTTLMVHRRRPGWISRQPRPPWLRSMDRLCALATIHDVHAGTALPSWDLMERISSDQLRIFTSETRSWY
jgi:hypothetical protein